MAHRRVASACLVGDSDQKVHDFQVRDTPTSVLYGLTLFYVVGYAVILILEFYR
jgi:hypothetical protein